jgi:hypothetical protein
MLACNWTIFFSFFGVVTFPSFMTIQNVVHASPVPTSSSALSTLQKERRHSLPQSLVHTSIQRHDETDISAVCPCRPYNILLVTKPDKDVVHYTREVASWLLGYRYTKESQSVAKVYRLNVFVERKVFESAEFDKDGLIREGEQQDEDWRTRVHSWDAVCGDEAGRSVQPLSDTEPDKATSAVANSKAVDLIITLGGDGTLLYTSSLFQGKHWGAQ